MSNTRTSRRRRLVCLAILAAVVGIGVVFARIASVEAKYCEQHYGGRRY